MSNEFYVWIPFFQYVAAVAAALLANAFLTLQVRSVIWRGHRLKQTVALATLVAARGRGVEPVPAARRARRSGLVSARRGASTVYYSPTSPEVAELLAVARRILASLAAATAPRRRPASASAQ